MLRRDALNGNPPCNLPVIIAPERSGGASYSETGVSNDQVSVCLSVRPSGKNGQITQNMCAGFKHLLFAVFDQSIFKVPKKTEDPRKRNDLAGPLKSRLFFIS